MLEKQCHKRPPISPSISGMVTIPSHEWLMTFFYPHENLNDQRVNLSHSWLTTHSSSLHCLVPWPDHGRYGCIQPQRYSTFGDRHFHGEFTNIVPSSPLPLLRCANGRNPSLETKIRMSSRSRRRTTKQIPFFWWMHLMHFRSSKRNLFISYL